MKLKCSSKTANIFIFLLCSSFILVGQNNFNNGAGNSDWHTAGNWSGGIPSAADVVNIPNGFSVNINMDAVARTIRLQGSTLNVMAGTLTLDEGMGGLDGIFFDDGGTLSITAGATLIIRNTDFAGIFVDNSTGNTATINNAGTITIGPNIDSYGIEIDNNNNSLKINNSGTINIGNTSDDGIRIHSMSSLNLINNGDFTIGTNIGRDGIRVMGTLQLSNSKTITFGPDLPSGDGIFVINGGSINLTNQTTGLLRTSTNPNIGFSFITIEDNPDMSSLISNFGNMTVDMDNNGEDFLNIFGGNASVVNQAGGIMTVSNVADDAFNFDGNPVVGGATFSNFGTINATNTMDEAFDISTPGSAINQASGVINVNGVMDQDAFNITGTFTNDGKITIADVQTEAGIDVEASGGTGGSFINNNFVSIAIGGTNNIAIEVDATTSLINATCAIINITTPDPIVNNGTITNNGILTTIFTGVNTNNGTFNNSGRISTLSKVFALTPNPLIGSNTIITNSPIPATTCLPPIDIPTMNQWGLAIFGLLVMNLGLLSLYQLKEIRNINP